MTTSMPSAHNEVDLRRGSFARGPDSPLERGQNVLLLVLFLLTAVAWALTIHQTLTMDMPMGVVPRAVTEVPDTTMPPAGDMDDMNDMGATAMDDAATMAATGMTGAGWSVAGFASFLGAWAVMMAAMMFPAAAPMLLLFRTMTTQRQAGTGTFAPTWVFAAGYLLVWTAVGVLTWILVQVLSDFAGQLGAAERATWAPIALGAVFIGAGLYQVTPLKQVCLDHCRSPLAFVMQHWRSGYGGALQMGIVHGLYRLGCCWALFAVLVAAGVMSLAWMLLLTLVIFAEKVLPGGRRTSLVVGIVFLVLGIGVLVGVVTVPWVA